MADEKPEETTNFLEKFEEDVWKKSGGQLVFGGNHVQDQIEAQTAEGQKGKGD